MAESKSAGDGVGALPSAPPPTFSYDCFLAHEWGVHDRVKRVNAWLKSKGFTTWFDDERMAGHVTDKMCRGIDCSQCVIVFITQRYINKVASADEKSDWCKLEFNYATLKRAGRIIPVVMEADVRDQTTWSGAVGMHLGRQHLIST